MSRTIKKDFQEVTPNATLEGVTKLTKDIKKSLVNISKEEARYLVDTYYQIQSFRIATAGQVRSIEQGVDEASTHGALTWYLDNLETMENELKKALDTFTDSSWIGRWAKANMGIGPTIAACLIANFDIDKAASAGHFWSYAGLNDNNRPWIGKVEAEKIVSEVLGNSKQITDEHLIEISKRTKWPFTYLEKSCTVEGKRKKDKLRACISIPPYNIKLKQLCWKIGQQFVKVSNKENSLYGKMYKERKAYETMKNENGEYAEQAARILASKNYGKDTDAYKAYIEGKLPKAHIAARAERYAVKLFISHLFEAMWYNKYNEACPNPYPIDHMGHVEYIGPEVPFESVE
jgi:hypothetical protein